MRLNSLRRWPRLLALLLPLTGAGCTNQLIPNTDLEDTPENRGVVEFCELYRHAVERRDIDKLLTLAHPDYYEDGGNVDATDDLDYAGLKTYLEGEFVRARAIRYEIHYRRILKNERNGWDIAYTYSASYKLPEGDEEVWHREVAENQLVLVEAGDSFRIVSGM
ncbi:MAG: hypothetical protein RL033_5210 [Pseudomonadota bacterium]|jgi:hypothetical protein